MKSKLSLLLLLATLSVFAQTKFKKGYFIDNSGQKTDCLIRDVDWKYNPTQFEYKISENDAVRIAGIENVKEFNIIDIANYIKADVDIDISQDNINYISQKKEPIFIKKTLFLKFLIEGTNNLYSYESNEYPLRLFYNNQKAPLQQLVYKKYFQEDNKTDVFNNENFKRQLFTNVTCKSISQKTIENLEYDKSDLSNYFIKVNACMGDTVSKRKSIDNVTKVNFKPVISFNNGSFILDYKYGTFAGKNDFGNKNTFGVGLEVEFVLPYNHFSWSVILEPSYINPYKSEINIHKFNHTYPDYRVRAIINYFQLPIIGRKYIYLNKNNKLFLNIGFNFNILLNSSKIITERNDGTELDKVNLKGTIPNLVFGVGYQYKKLNIEYRYYTTTNLNPAARDSDSYNYKKNTISLKYLLF